MQPLEAVRDAIGSPAIAAPRPLRILRLVAHLGDESAPLNHFTLAAPRDHRVTLCTFFPVREKLPPSIRLLEGDGTIRGYIRTMRGVLASGETDLVHAHSPHVALLSLTAWLTSSARRPPAILTVDDSFRSFSLPNRLMLLPAFACFDRIVCCGRASRDSFPPLYRRLAGDRLRFVQNGVDLERIQRIPPDASSRPDRPFTVISVTRLVRIKNTAATLDAFLRADDGSSRLVLVGTGNLYDALSARVAWHGSANRIEFAGLIPRDAVYRRLRAADVFISTSRGEGLPVAVLEAMACGRPVILSDIPPHREIVGSADFIPLVAPDDVERFATEIHRIRTMRRPDRDALGARCRRHVERRFDLSRMHRAYEDIFDAVIRTRMQPAAPRI